MKSRQTPGKPASVRRLMAATVAALAATACVPMQQVQPVRQQQQVQQVQPAPQLQRRPPPGDPAWQRYEVNQTFQGYAYFKDHSNWVYDKAFADLFGMPAKHIERIEGAAAAAFRLEEAPYKMCGFGGRDEACGVVEQCYLDLYFDEAKTPLPWATDQTRYAWLPQSGTLRWLRPVDPKEKWNEPATPPGVKRQVWDHASLIAFADGVSKMPAHFTSNQDYDKAGPDDRSTGLSIDGYARQFYRTLSLVSVDMPCSVAKLGAVNLSLDVRDGPLGPALVRFNRITLPEGFVQRIKDVINARRQRNSDFYRSLFPPPLGTRDTPPAAPQPK